MKRILAMLAVAVIALSMVPEADAWQRQRVRSVQRIVVREPVVQRQRQTIIVQQQKSYGVQLVEPVVQPIYAQQFVQPVYAQAIVQPVYSQQLVMPQAVYAAPVQQLSPCAQFFSK